MFISLNPIKNNIDHETQCDTISTKRKTKLSEVISIFLPCAT